MRRRSSDGRSGRPGPRAAPRRDRNAPPPAHVKSGGIGSTIAQGMAFGAGSAVADRAVDAIIGPRKIREEAVVTNVVTAPAPTANTFGSDPCIVHTKAFHDCLVSSHRNDIRKCEFYLDMLTECTKNSRASFSA